MEWRPVRADAEAFDGEADRLALELVACLASPDPELRDRIGYELMTYWLRGGKLTDHTRGALVAGLSARVADRDPGAGLVRSFSALILAEVMRSDAQQGFMDDAARAEVLGLAAHALVAERDYRGLEADIGWVHPVAHLADVLWRFALHPATTTAETGPILEAVGAQVAPRSVGYVFNEPDRLARVVAALARRGGEEQALVARWLGRFQSPVGMATWGEAFQSPEGMMELHNTKAFLRALSDQLAGVEVDPALSEALAELVAGFTGLV